MVILGNRFTGIIWPHCIQGHTDTDVYLPISPDNVQMKMKVLVTLSRKFWLGSLFLNVSQDSLSNPHKNSMLLIVIPDISLKMV